MKLLVLLVLIGLLQLINCSTEKCYDDTEHCHSTNYQTYVDCVRKRQKRSLDCNMSCNGGNCINTCNNCDCDLCNYSNCENSCNNCCSSCCSNYVSCRTNHCCHKTCHAQCDNTQCRSDCRRNCFNTIQTQNGRSTYIDAGGYSGGGSSSNYSSVNLQGNTNRHNVTTIIHLNNVINNTNIIDVPIALNNTNEQNITLYSQGTSLSSGQSNAQIEKCCTVIGPRQCVATPVPRCVHYRSKQCGEFCTASIVHKEQQQVCESLYPGAPPNCRQQIYYIPQPQPRCVYQSVWPYVSCGIQGSASCEGCYNHYVNQESSNHLNCPNQCYDEGFNIGPMYRQGPYYRPWYSHAPCYSCYGLPDPYIGGNSPYGYGGPYGGQPPYPIYNVPFDPPPFNYPIVEQPNQNISLKELETDLIAANSSVILEPVITVNSGFGAPYVPVDPYRGKDVEIEVNVDPPSPAQAQVKIKHGEETDKSKRRKNTRIPRGSTKETENATTTIAS